MKKCADVQKEQGAIFSAVPTDSEAGIIAYFRAYRTQMIQISRRGQEACGEFVQAVSETQNDLESRVPEPAIRDHAKAVLEKMGTFAGMTVEAFSAQEKGFTEMDVDNIKAAAALYNRLPSLGAEIQDGIRSLGSEVIESRSQPQNIGSAPVSRVPPVPKSIQEFLSKWRSSVLGRDNKMLTTCYAPRLNTFFRKHDVDRLEVEQTNRAFLDKYLEIVRYDIADPFVEATDSESAAISFVKTWEMRGPDVFTGRERELLHLVQVDGEWRITGEEELQIFEAKHTPVNSLQAAGLVSQN